VSRLFDGRAQRPRPVSAAHATHRRLPVALDEPSPSDLPCTASPSACPTTSLLLGSRDAVIVSLRQHTVISPAPLIRRATRDDVAAIERLYITVASTTGGLARQPDEISREYIDGFVTRSLADGEIVVAEVAGVDGVAGELHAYRNPLRLFNHVYTNLTIAVHPDVQGRGVGRALFTALLDTVTQTRPDIVRVELMTAERNQRAQRLYESVGFIREGRLDRAIRGRDGTPEADIPMAWFRSARPT
jgi:ribosomal protein S18 acetylase RimI-like enzyme